MTGDLVDKDGALAAGSMSLYQLIGGLVLWSETAEDVGNGYVFDTRKTVVVQVLPHPGQANGRRSGEVALARAFELLLGMPRRLFVPRTSVAMVSDVSDTKLLANARAAASGLVAPGGLGPK